MLTNVANGAASALGGVRSAVASGPNLANLLPGGASNPLLGLLQGVTSSVTGQLLNRNGCALYCVDLRDQAWISDGCICNLDRVKVRARAGRGRQGRQWGESVVRAAGHRLCVACCGMRLSSSTRARVPAS